MVALVLHRRNDEAAEAIHAAMTRSIEAWYVLPLYGTIESCAVHFSNIGQLEAAAVILGFVASSPSGSRASIECRRRAQEAIAAMDDLDSSMAAGAAMDLDEIVISCLLNSTWREPEGHSYTREYSLGISLPMWPSGLCHMTPVDCRWLGVAVRQVISGPAYHHGVPPGAISAIFVYPIKSSRSVAVDSATVSAIGLAGDRIWQVVDGEQRGLTQRQHRVLATVQPEPLDDGGLLVQAPGMSPIAVEPPGEQTTIVQSHFRVRCRPPMQENRRRNGSRS